MNLRYLFIFVFLSSLQTKAQTLESAKKNIRELCSPAYFGRGYVNNGVNLAALYLEEEFKKFHLQPFGETYTQSYSFPVNTFPNIIQCKVDGEIKKVGVDFLVNADCGELHGSFTLLHFNMNDSLEKLLLFKKIEKGFEPTEALVLHHFSSRDNVVTNYCKAYSHTPTLIITTEDKKLTHTISQTVGKQLSLTFIDSSLTKGDRLDIDETNEFVADYRCKNIAGFIKGKKKKNKQLLVFTAHYDHLGMLGTNAIFPGASDNASGVSMILYLAEYYSTHQPDIDIAFILFSGEEAGLLGSQYFVTHPMFDLNKIKFLINLDIMGNAEKGIVVVNGEQYKTQFDLLTKLNEKNHFLPEVRIRGKAKNSDHYHFSEAGVPSIFIYSNGGLGYYHDVFDVANSIDLTNYENVAKLLMEFVKKME